MRRERVPALWPTRRDGLWLVAAAVLFGALDLLVHGPGPHAGLAVRLSVDVSLLFLARFPVRVASWALVVAVLLLLSGQLAPGLLVPVPPATHLALPVATPAIVTNLVRLVDGRRAAVLVGLLAAVGTRFWDPAWDTTPLGLVNTLLPALAVLYLRARGQLVDSLRERAERAEREQVLLAERARAAERRRLAEEMHDVVTHRLSLVVLHAGALGVGSAEPAVRAAAEDIRQACALALTELRDLVGVLRTGGEVTAGAPAEPTAPDPRTLVDEARAVGERVSYSAGGVPGRVSPTVRRTAYRVVQESLTNARKHAPGAEVAVVVDYRGDGVTVRVTNGPARWAADDALASSGSGVGLLGLGQRVELVGGALHAGPTPDGGFRVDAALPAYVPTREDAG
ncbi:sensor histidine kinase [Saccharothrix yanglingensis]|uniref:histidine kinase n=1 Tax=Saccharothrix yanglingensis TaxID=659496 RepID=A0ABU0X9K6_9PSEU|nr:sensor histidine kinase [Saccharothrix yanglingensis]MDQ2588287.1 two-component sensor histidine kinase [Saccharothrix yanglingensis]